MGIFLVAISIILITIIGFLVIRLFNTLAGYSLIETLSYSYGLGVGIIAFQMFIYSLLNIPWNIEIILLPWVIVCIFVIFLNPKIFKLANLKFQFRLIDILISSTISLTILFVGFEALIRPLSAWDGWATWLMKAKIFYVDGFINPSTLKFYNLEYPQAISLVASFIYKIAGKVDDRAVLLMFFMFYVSLAGILYFYLRRVMTNTGALLITFLLISTQNFIRHGGRFEAGYVDLALGYYFLACTLLLLSYLKNKSLKNLGLLSIFLGISSQIKNEGLPFVLLIGVILIICEIKIKRYAYIWINLFWLIPIVSWQLFKHLNHFPLLPPYIGKNIDIGRTFTVIIGTIEEFLKIQNWNLLWITFFVSIIFKILNPNKNKIDIIYLIIFFQLFVYFFIFLITPIDPITHIRNIMNRLLLHIAPLAVFTTGVILFGKEKEL